MGVQRRVPFQRDGSSIPRTPPSAPGAAAASCTSASRSTTTGCSPSCAPTSGIPTVLTADAYGAGEADRLLGRALEGLDRDAYCLVGAVGHDFYDGEREGAKGFPRFTDPRLRGPDGYAAYLRTATERSLRAHRRRRVRPAAPAQPRPHGLHAPGGLGGDGRAARRGPDAR